MSKLLEVSDANFEQEILKSDIPAIVQFARGWYIYEHNAPVLEKLAKVYVRRVKVARLIVGEKNPKTLAQYGYQVNDDLIIFNNGQVVDQIKADQDYSYSIDAIKNAIDKIINEKTGATDGITEKKNIYLGCAISAFLFVALLSILYIGCSMIPRSFGDAIPGLLMLIVIGIIVWSVIMAWLDWLIP